MVSMYLKKIILKNKNTPFVKKTLQKEANKNKSSMVGKNGILNL